ncbi:uncharacterized protein [Medicago truncatula]|uniref:Hemopexin n=1 Tax=Medicago truncatula TaxID=3880 RepID=Q2HS44_MEDTR|nr:uncharacterized protein LOC112419459 [Medicago truncatula]ABD33127.1 Hemopexin [Medicago truncatula]
MRGRVQHPQWLFSGFREAVNDCGLIDMPMQGHTYTWSRRMGSNHVVEERLDRALVNNSWMTMFPQCLLKNLVTGASDHSPILLCTEQKFYDFKKRQFRFENSWLVEPELDSVVHDGWFHDVNEPMITRLQHCTEELDQWGRSLRKRYKEDIQKCKDIIEELQGLGDVETDGEIVLLKEKLNLLLIQEDTFWKQRAKIFWMKDGDMNAKFFHAAATSRKQKNKITKLFNDEDVEISS